MYVRAGLPAFARPYAGIHSVVYWPPTPPNIPFQRRRKYIFHWRGRAWLTIWDRVKIPRYSSQTDAPEESDLWTAWQLFLLDDDQTCHSKDGGSDSLRWPVMGRYWVGVNYYITECTGNSIILERRCGREKQHPTEGSFGTPDRVWRQDVEEKAST